jgi:hypothetical protein
MQNGCYELPEIIVRSGVFMLVGLLISFSAFAEKEIVLKDGSRLRGEVLSMQNGLYEIRTESMGTVQLGSRQIQSITSLGGAAPGEATGADSTALSQSAVDSIKSSIVSNPGVMSRILQLQNDPEMRAVLADPEIMRAVQSFDLQTLSNNPKIKALMDNDKIQSISDSVN